jgi:hypothetical protein
MYGEPMSCMETAEFVRGRMTHKNGSRTIIEDDMVLKEDSIHRHYARGWPMVFNNGKSLCQCIGCVGPSVTWAIRSPE